MTGTVGTSPLALVTGASKGLGAALARFLAGEGFDLIVTARHAPDLEAMAASLDVFETRVFAVPGDVTDPGHRHDLARRVEDHGAGLDLLVNNASTLGPSPLPSLTQHPLPELESVFRTNVVAPIALVSALLPALVSRRGQVINISSDAAVAGYPGWGGYGASKAALDLASLTLAHELEGRGVSVVAVDPGDMRTDMHQAAFPNEDISDRPLPDVTLPFWAWLLHQPRAAVSGHRFRARSERWEVPT